MSVVNRCEREGVSGAVCHTVLTFHVDKENTVTPAEYWEHRDGTHYPTDIRAEFKGRPFPDTQEYQPVQQLNNYW